MIAPLPGRDDNSSPAQRTRPLPGIAAEIRNEKGEKIEVGGGLLAITRPWPSMLRGIYGDPERYVTQVLEQVGHGRLRHRRRSQTRRRWQLLVPAAVSTMC